MLSTIFRNAEGLIPLRLQAHAIAASVHSSFHQTHACVCHTGTEEEDDLQPLDSRRLGKSFDPVVDILLDLSVASLLTSSSVSGQLSRQQQQQVRFGRGPMPNRLVACT